MPLHVLQLDAGTEYLLPWTRNKLNFWHAESECSGQTLVRKTVRVSDGSVIHAWSQNLGNGVWMDKIRIVGGGHPAVHAFFGFGVPTFKLRLLDVDGASIFLSDTILASPQLVGISGNGRFAFVLGGTTAPGTPIGDTRILYVFKDLELYQTLTYTFPVDTTATYAGFPNDGFLNGGNLVSYDGSKAIAPVSIDAGGGQGVLIFNDAAVPKLRYFITPSMLDVFSFSTPYIAVPDLSKWGWLDSRVNPAHPGDSDSVFHSFDSDDVETQTVFSETSPQSATFSRNGALIVDYYKYVLATTSFTIPALNVGGTEYLFPPATVLSGSLAPWLASSDASKILADGHLFSSGVFSALPGTALCVSLDGSTYVWYDVSTLEATIVRDGTDISGGDFWFGNGNSHASALYAFAGLGAQRPVAVGWPSGFGFAPAGILSTDGKVLRQVGYYSGNKQDTYQLNDDETEYVASTTTFAAVDNEYDNVYTKTPV